MKLIAGLGNPGTEYDDTPHNVGFAVVDQLAHHLEASWKRSWRFKARVAQTHLANHKLILTKPQTYMNLSGSSVAPLLRYHRGTAANLVVVLDDADLPLGTLRIRPGGGSGGHRGLASIITALATQDFPRIRLGVGRHAQADLVNHVLGKFTPQQHSLVQLMVETTIKAVECLTIKGLNEAMNQFNGWHATDIQPLEQM